MTSSKGRDQRKHPRIDSRFPIRSGADPGDQLEMESLNLSLEGVYCSTVRYVPVMTKLLLTLHLPAVPGLKPPSPDGIQTEAVVVRVEPDPDGKGERYNLALFFSQITREDRVQLAEFLDLERKSKE